MEKVENIFTVSERCTQNQVSQFEVLQESKVRSRRFSYMSSTSLINMSMAKIGLQKLNRIIKIKTRHDKRNAFRALRVYNICGIERNISRKYNEQLSKGQILKSKSSSKLELLNDIMDKLQRKPTLKTSVTDSYLKFDKQSKTSNQVFQPFQRLNTQQSVQKNFPNGMNLKKLRQNIMTIRSQLNQIQTVNNSLHLQNRFLKLKQQSQSMKQFFPRQETPFYIQVPTVSCIDCGNQFIPPIKLAQSRQCYGYRHIRTQRH